MIFPEGRLTETGALMKVYDGPGMVADRFGQLPGEDLGEGLELLGVRRRQGD